MQICNLTYVHTPDYYTKDIIKESSFEEYFFEFGEACTDEEPYTYFIKIELYKGSEYADAKDSDEWREFKIEQQKALTEGCIESGIRLAVSCCPGLETAMEFGVGMATSDFGYVKSAGRTTIEQLGNDKVGTTEINNMR